MQIFAESYPDERLVQQAAGLIPWMHNCAILDKVKEAHKREWYIYKTIENGWSRNVFVHMPVLLPTCALILHHARPGVTASHYDFAVLDGQVRPALQRWANHV